MALGFWFIKNYENLRWWDSLFSGSFSFGRGGVVWQDALCCSAGLLQQVLPASASFTSLLVFGLVHGGR